MFLTGEFSRIARVSKRMLHHYDRIGLFSPIRTDPQTGYRYYSAQQLPRLNRILALKDLGLSLEQISRMIDQDVSLDELRGMLMMQKAELEKQLLEGLERIQSVESRLARLSEDQYAPDVVLKSVAAQPYIATRRVFADLADGQAVMDQLMSGLPARVGTSALGHLISIMHSPAFEMENSDSEIGFLLEKPVSESIALSPDLTLTLGELPAVETMATVVQIGVMDMLPAGYAALADWVETHNYQIAGPQREIYIEMPPPGSQHELVVEIQFPVQRRTSTLPADITH
ncbi:MAG: MerR family transcriptional regulator [Chloroflexota bacterium]